MPWREEHYRKHRELRTGENNSNYGKHLYSDGVSQKYISDDEIEEYESKGWYKGANNAFKIKMSNINSGINNPFYSKHHTEEAKEKAKSTKLERNISTKGYLLYHKNGERKFIKPEEREQYENDGWVHGHTKEDIEKITKTKRENPKSHKWTEKMIKSKSVHFIYENIDLYGYNNLIKYLRENGFPEIGKKSIKNIVNGIGSKTYPELNNKIKIEKEK